VFVFSPGPVLDQLDALAADAGEEGLADLGDKLLPDLTRAGLARAWSLPGYWRDVGTVAAYWDAHRDFLTDDPPLRLDDPRWPIHTRGGADAAAQVAGRAQVDDCLLAAGTRVAGTVRGSVLSPGVVVEAGATVVDSVLLPGVRVRAGATVQRAILDDDVVVGPGALVGGDGGVALVGAAAELASGAVVVPGGRWPEPD
jgi:glucose-1-phosphate adenylyltransferase